MSSFSISEISVSNQNQTNETTESSKSVTNMVFTRYLYIKREVEISLLFAILNKKDDAALFWAFELYYSGFAQELLYLVWRIYFEFFATLNPNLEAYLLKKHKEFDNCIVVGSTNYPYPFSSKGYKLKPKNDDNTDNNNYETKETIIASIIHNLLSRKFNTDVFILREICCNIEIEKPYPAIKECFASHNYELISYYIIETGDDNNDSKNNENIMNAALEYFASSDNAVKTKFFKGWKNTSDELLKYNINPKLIMLSRIMHYYSLLQKDLKMGKNLYITVDSDDLLLYETIYADVVKAAYRVLPVVTTFAHNVDYLKLFKVDELRPKNIMDCYYYNWLYYASFSPVWEERIQMFEGIIDHKNKKVIFEDDEENDVFYDNYGYYPDEQTKEIQQKNIPNIPEYSSFTWTKFYEKYKNNGLYHPGEDELDALNGAEP